MDKSYFFKDINFLISYNMTSGLYFTRFLSQLTTTRRKPSLHISFSMYTVLIFIDDKLCLTLM